MKVLDFELLTEKLKSMHDKRIAITFHSIGDTDAIASAYALKAYLPNSKILTPDIITSNAKHITRELGFKDSIQNVFDPNVESVIMLDVNNFEDCGPFERNLNSFGNEILIIDHHLMKQISKENVSIFNSESYSSTSSIVFSALEALGFSIERNIAIMLALGILSDSAEFKNSNALTFEQIGKLISMTNVDYNTLLQYIHHVAMPEERAEMLMGLFKSSVSVKYGLLFVQGFAKNGANILADNAIRVGADVAIFYSISNGEVSFSARLRPPLDKKFDIHLGYIMKKLAPLIDGTGGGHPCAAGAYGKEQSGINDFIENFNLAIKERVENS
ncbi:MAG: DHH family phosphoesterase [Candidatus Micrarchaeia archaeon]